MLDLSKLVDVQIDGIDIKDYPDFVDAFICYAAIEFTDITGNKDYRDLTDNELDYLNDHERDWIYEKALAQAF